MKTVWKISLLILLVGAGLSYIAIVFLRGVKLPGPPADPLPYYKLYADVVKSIWIGVVVTLLGVFIPVGVGEVRYRFERLKESRVAYSEAKTGLDYLPLRLSSLDLEAAAAHIQRVHVFKHQAELYDELVRHLRYRNTYRTRIKWGNAMYESLFKVRRVLEDHSGAWDRMDPSVRLELLLKARPSAPDEGPDPAESYWERFQNWRAARRERKTETHRGHH